MINASGRSGRLVNDMRAPEIGGDCGLAYVSRQYEFEPGAEFGPMNTPVGLVRTLNGYMIAVFLQDNRTFSALIARPSSDRRLAALRFPEAFEAAARAIPGLAEWIDPDRAHPITPVLPGGRLRNTYRGQLDEQGRVPLPGLVHVGDAVCTTNPTAGRGIAVGLRQAQHLVELIGSIRRTSPRRRVAFDEWCTANIRPWYDDHVYWDADILRRWAGGDVDVTRRLPSDLILEAIAADRSLMRVAGPYMAMEVLPSALDEIEPRAGRSSRAAGARTRTPARPATSWPT